MEGSFVSVRLSDNNNEISRSSAVRWDIEVQNPHSLSKVVIENVISEIHRPQSMHSKSSEGDR